MKTSRVVGCVAVAFAYASACGGASAPSPFLATADGGGESGSAESGTDDASAVDESLVATSGGSEAGGVEAATGTAPGTSPSQAPSRTGYCCVGGAYYGCPTHAALAKCTGFDVSGCLEDCPQADTACARACSQNASNAQTDPSACTHVPSMDSTCADFDAGSSSTGSSSGSAPPAPPPTPKNACGGFFTGTECQVGGGCIGGGHCTQGKCYPNDVGNPCIYASDCGDGNHCTSGCCANSSKGSACDAPWDCTSGKCTSNVCQ